jgi:hypothetical protein
MIFHGRRFGFMTQAGRSWQIRVPMGRTLHRNRSNTRRSLLTTRQENRERWKQHVECRTTTAVLRIEGLLRQELLSHDPLNPEHKATGRVLWVNSTICVSMFLLFHSGAPTLESYEIKISTYQDPVSMIIRGKFTRLFTTWYLTTKICTVQR